MTNYNNNLRQRLGRGETVVGSWLNSGSPIVAELMAQMGFDFLTVDAEHSAVDLPQTQAMLQAIRAGNPDCAALVRLPDTNYATTKRFMDAGAAGVIAPLVNTAAQAAEVVRAVKYPPLGGRGVGFCRANKYGAELTPETLNEANEATFVCVQIEHAEALAHLDEIFTAGPIDAALIGPYDLSASLGVLGDFAHPLMQQAERAILAACRKHGVAAGIHVVQPAPAAVRQRISEGYRFIAYSLDITLLQHAGCEGLRAIRQTAAVGKRQTAATCYAP